MNRPEPNRHLIALPDSGITIAFRRIPAGIFRMGERGVMNREEPVHRVVIPESFWMAETPVTQAQFAVWKPEHKNGFPGNPNHPAENLTWDEARDFGEWLTAECGSQFPEGDWVADLPDEARWEYACRAGTETVFHSGDGEEALAEAGWYDENSENETHPVGAKAPNPWGLHDLHGNVWEWCADVFDGGAFRKRLDGWQARSWELDDAGDDAEYWGDEDRKAQSPSRVLRGGSWLYSARLCRAAFRLWHRPSLRSGRLGFRLCLARSSPAQDNRAEAAPGGVARRDAAAKPDKAGGAGEPDAKRPA